MEKNPSPKEKNFYTCFLFCFSIFRLSILLENSSFQLSHFSREITNILEGRKKTGEKRNDVSIGKNAKNDGNSWEDYAFCLFVVKYLHRKEIDDSEKRLLHTTGQFLYSSFPRRRSDWIILEFFFPIHLIYLIFSLILLFFSPLLLLKTPLFITMDLERIFFFQLIHYKFSIIQVK